MIAQATDGFVGLILALWIVCGLVNLCGALSMAELSAMFPHAGGTYVFLRETYGRLWSFLWAWAEFWVIRTGAIAALAVYTAVALEEISGSTRQSNFASGHQKSIADRHDCCCWRRSTSSARGGAERVQNMATIIKAGFVAFLAVLPFIAIGSEPFELGALWPGEIDQGLVVGIGRRWPPSCGPTTAGAT